MRIFKTAMFTYVLVQVVTGVEVGLMTVALVVFWEVKLTIALAATISMGFPLMLIQGWFAAAWHAGIIKEDDGEAQVSASGSQGEGSGFNSVAKPANNTNALASPQSAPQNQYGRNKASAI